MSESSSSDASVVRLVNASSSGRPTPTPSPVHTVALRKPNAAVVPISPST